MIYGRIFFIIFIFFLNGIREKKVQSASIEDLPHEILEEILNHSSISSIESLRYVCRRLYLLTYEYFGIGLKIVDLFSLEKPKNNTLVLCYHSFHTSYQLKKMFSIFLNSSPNIKDHVKLAQIESFQFEPDSIPFLFQQAMLARHPTKKDTFFQKGVKLLQLKQNQDDYPVAKDFLAICYRHGLGVDQNEQQAEILEDEVSLHLHTHFHRPRFPWSFQLWIEPVFIRWLEEGSAWFLHQAKKVKDFLNASFLNQGEHLRSYACVEFLKDWLKSNSTQEGIHSFLQDHDHHIIDKFQLCTIYLSILTELGILKGPWQSTWTEINDSTKVGKVLQPVLEWLTFKTFKKEVNEIYEAYEDQEVASFLVAQILLGYIHILSSIFENLDELNIFKEKIIPNFLESFNDEKKDDQDEILLQKFSFIEFLEIFPYPNWDDHSIQHSVQNWLKSEKLQAHIQNKMLDESFFQKEWLDYDYIVMYFIKKNQEIAEKALENVFEYSKDIHHQVQLAQYLNQLGKFSISHLESIKNNLKYKIINHLPCDQEFSILKYCFKIGCYQLVKKEIYNVLHKNLENMSQRELCHQWQLAGLCALSKDCNLRVMIHPQWTDVKKIRLALKKIQIQKVNFPKDFQDYLLKDRSLSFSSSDMGIIYFNSP